MANLIIDIGNTQTKLAIFEDGHISHHQLFPVLTVSDLEQVLDTYPIERSIVSTVDQTIEEFEAFLTSRTKYTRFHALIACKVSNQYGSPHTLGLDRWAAVIGANALYPQQNCLVIDAGTCITYDMVSSDAIYSGGSISEGIRMRFEALHTFTGRLPLVDWDQDFDASLGTDTRTAIMSGVVNGILYEVNGFIEQYYKYNEDVKVILTGGDAAFFDRRLKSSIFAPSISLASHLVLIGLNEVITYQDV